MTELLLTPVETTDADRATIAAGTPSAVLVHRAGQAVARAVRTLLGGVYGRRVVVVCGKGNNGADGLVAARALSDWGVRVDVFRLADGWSPARFARALGRADAAVDAMYGTGFRGVLDGDAATVASAFAHASATRGTPVVAVDIASGVDGATGAVRGPAVRAELTVTFTARKPGHVFEPGRSSSGGVDVVDVGVDPALATDRSDTGIVTEHDVAAWLPPRAPDAHKWSAAVFVVGGSGGMTGAPVFASRAALRSGAGMVRCGVPGAQTAQRLAGAEVIAVALPASDAGSLTRDAVVAVQSQLDRFGALVLGPGLGNDPEARAAAVRLALDASVPVVLDADGLNAFEGDVSALRARRESGAPPVVLTPHAGEYQRLTGHAVGDDRLAAARELAVAAGSVVLLKGPSTVVAGPDGRVLVSTTGGPWLATAGTGDVLSGILGAFLARGVPALEAAAAAAWVHGRAADVAGHVGLVASDLLGALPSTLGRIGVPLRPGPATGWPAVPAPE